MSVHPSSIECVRAADADFERWVERFEVAWQSGSVPRVRHFLPARRSTRRPADRVLRRRVLLELIKVDLEYRWRLATAPRILEEYRVLMSELSPLDVLPVELIAEEYRVRRRWGDQPAVHEYADRFPRQWAEVAGALAQVDAELDGAATVACRPPQAPAVTPEPERVGGARYALGAVVGSGAFGTVWQAHDTELARAVAVKLPRNLPRNDAAGAERFLREARAAGQLRHPGIVAIHDVGRDGPTLYIVSELVRGKSLAQWLKGGCVAHVDAAALVAGVADALEHAHRHGVVHRDVKPSNILLESAGGDPAAGRDGIVALSGPGGAVVPVRPKLTDFGLALYEPGEPTLTLDGQILGTPAYMSPEQIRDAHVVDGRSDVYSLGVILYELLTGSLPFDGDSRTLLLRVLHDEAAPPRRVNPRIPIDLETICLKCLAKEPGRRYRTAGALASDLRRWQAGLPIEARRVGRVERLGLWIKRNPALTVTAGLGVVGFVAVAGAPLAMGLVAIAVGAVLFALHKARASTELAQMLAETSVQQEKTAALLNFAVKHCALAREERDRAQRSAALVRRRLARAEETMHRLLFDGPPSAFIVDIALTHLNALAAEAGDDALLRRELAAAYARLADVQMQVATLGPAAALATQQKSLALFTALAQAYPDNAQAQRDLAASRARFDVVKRAGA